MVINWYFLFNRQEFLDSEIDSRTVQVQLGEIGLKNVLITKGIAVGVTIDDVFLTCELNDKNPYRRGDRLIFVDENENVFWGVLNAD